jgi:uncharacterized membrane protein HdeD (DUF308 family)
MFLAEAAMDDLMTAGALRHLIRKTWWIPLAEGIVAVLFGLLLITRPGPTLVFVTIMLGAFWLVGGIAEAVGALMRRESDRHWVFSLVSSLLSILVGLLLLARPMLGFLLTSLTVVGFIAFGAIVSGVLGVIWAIRVRRDIEGEGWIILFGALSIAFGLMLLASPMVSVLALVQFAAVLFIVGGIGGIITAFRLRGLAVPVHAGRR